MTAKELKDLLDTEVVALSFVWKLYKSMYGNPTNVEKMNKLSGTAFGLLQRAQTADLIRRVCAITDNPRGGENLVLRLVAEQWQVESGRPLPANVEQKLANAEASTRLIRKHRNKLYAHLDVRTKRRNGANLPRLMGQHLDDGVKAVFQAMSALTPLVDGTNVAYELATLGAEGEFEWMLTDALRFEHLRRLSSDKSNTDSAIRRLLDRRSGRTDPEILASIAEEEEADG